MRCREGYSRRRTVMAAAAMFAGALVLGQPELGAQEKPATPAEAAAPATAAEAAVPATAAEAAPAATDQQEPSAPSEGALSSEELQALVAPIALYPDLVLVLTLQASLAPLDIVQAERFLARYAEDPSLTPDANLDESVIGLLNYPSVIHGMNADLDWTETLGQAVVTQLEGVQDAIQEIRAFMHAVGAFQSNDKLIVIVEGDIIRIEPADPNAVVIPQYDPEALLTALYSTDVAAPEAEAAPAEAVAPGEEAAAELAPAPAETAAAGAAAEAVPTTGVVPAAAPAYYPPPPMTYSDPSPSWLGTAATFAGGAAVGGLIGWAIADDDDDDDHDGDGGGDGNSESYSRGNVNVEDSNIVINRPDDEADALKQQAQAERLRRDARERAQREDAKQQLERKYARNQPRAAASPLATRSKSSGLATSARKPAATSARQSPGGRELTGRVEQAKAKAAPPGQVRQGSAGGKKSAVRPGDRKQTQVASAFGGKKSASQAKRDLDRGLQSRRDAKPEVKSKRSGGGGGSVFAQGGGRSAKAGGGGKQKRGKKSGGGKRK